MSAGVAYMVTAAAVADAGARPSQTHAERRRDRGGGGEREEDGRETETERRERLEVGSVIVSALILDQFTGYTRMCLSPPTRRSVSNATNPVNTHRGTRAPRRGSSHVHLRTHTHLYTRTYTNTDTVGHAYAQTRTLTD